MRALAENITAAVNPVRGISLELKNISSLGQSDVAAIRQELETELVRRGFHLGATSSAEARVEVSFSEGADKYVWVAKTHANDVERVAIVDVPRRSENSTGQSANVVVLGRRLAWQQSAKFLDFATSTGFDRASSGLWILEPDRVAIYSSVGNQWQFDRGIALPHHVPWPRDLHGSFDMPSGIVFLPGMTCTGAGIPGHDLQCIGTKTEREGAATGEWQQIKVEGLEIGDSLALRATCDGNSMVVATGIGDWTQPDSIQAYLEKDGRSVSSGDPIQIDGPVTALNWDAPGSGRVVVHNLKTGNYEGYIVTATCSH